MADPLPSIFVSYSHEDAALASALAAAMEDLGARVWLDQGELLIGDSLLERIAEAIAEFDFVAALVSHASVESNWCQKEIALAMSKQLRRGSRRVTVLPLRVGEVAMPASLADVKWEQLDADDVAGCAASVVRDASRHLSIGSRSARARPDEAHANEPERGFIAPESDVDQAVRIVGLDVEQTGSPRNDGSKGSALYKVVLKLNRIPHPAWAESFPEAWNSPPAWTSMHRPGIGRAVGDRIVLDGTTVEEFEQYHLKTLKLVVRQLNELLAKHLERERRRQDAEAQAAAEHDRQVREAADRLRFDD